jgi:beta-galactosidase
VVEGPSIFRRGGELVMIFDHYLEGRYGAARSKDGVDWEPVSLALPPGMRHASVLETPLPASLPPR